MNDQCAEAYQDLVGAFHALSQGSTVWVINGLPENVDANVIDRLDARQNSDRTVTQLQIGDHPSIKSNGLAMVFPTEAGHFYLFPLFGILETSKGSQVFEIRSLKITHSDVIFLETDHRYADGDVISYHNPRDGASSNQKQRIPFMNYGALMARSTTGDVVFYLLVSKQSLVEEFAQRFYSFQAAADELTKSNPSESFVFEGIAGAESNKRTPRQAEQKERSRWRFFPLLDFAVLALLIILTTMWFPTIMPSRSFVDELTNRFSEITVDFRPGTSVEQDQAPIGERSAPIGAVHGAGSDVNGQQAEQDSTEGERGGVGDTDDLEGLMLSAPE